MYIVEAPPYVWLQYEAQRSILEYFACYQQLEPTPTDFKHWLESLPYSIRAISICSGYQCALQNLSFKRYVLETRGYSLYDHLQATISVEAFA